MFKIILQLIFTSKVVQVISELFCKVQQKKSKQKISWVVEVYQTKPQG